MSSCLVTGGTGFLGTYVVRELRNLGNHVGILGRSAGNGNDRICADLTDAQLDLGTTRWPVVYHLAGLAHMVPQTSDQRNAFFRTNVDGTRNLLNALSADEQLPDAVVFVSSVSVYGLEEGTLLDESTPRCAADAYGASKREAEDVLLEWSCESGVPVTIVRLPLVLGRGAPGNLAAMIRALSRRRYFRVGKGDGRRSMVMAEDVARFLPKMVGVAGTFHLTDSRHPSIQQLETALSTALGQSDPPRLPLGLARLGASCGDRLQRLTGRPMPFTSRTLNKMTHTLTVSDERAQREFGWQPTSVLDRITEIVEPQLLKPVAVQVEQFEPPLRAKINPGTWTT